MDKLGDFASQTERFLRSLARDLGMPVKKGEWLASSFTNDSVAFDAELAEAVPEAVIARGNEALDLITGDDPIAACDRGLIDYTTAAEFSRLVERLIPTSIFSLDCTTTGKSQVGAK